MTFKYTYNLFTFHITLPCVVHLGVFDCALFLLLLKLLTAYSSKIPAKIQKNILTFRRMSIFLRTTKSSPITKRFTSFPLFRTHTAASFTNATFRKSTRTMMSLSRAAVPAPPSIRRTSAGDNNKQDQRVRGEQVRTFAFGARKAPKGQLPEREPNMGLDPENAQAKVRS